MTGKRFQTVVALMLGAATVMTIPASWARDEISFAFDLPEQDLSDALRAVTRRAGWELYMPAARVAGVKAPALSGKLSAREAIESLLRGSGLRARFLDEAVIISDRSAPADAAMSEQENQITVTGTRIKGTPSAAPLRVITADDMRRAGQADLGEVLRSSPLNFGGGQNPGVGRGQGASDVNVNGSSSVNLLGLGPNATLTLLNGNRLSYTGINSAVDIGAIPAVAVDRVEIIADGASAIYGSDAVAGVVNVILKRDYEGLASQARMGASTDGGNFQQQYNVTGGQRWSSGGVLAVYDYSANSEISAASRSYASASASDSYLYPRLGRHSALISAHQDIGTAVTANVDMLYKDVRQNMLIGFLAGQPHSVLGSAVRTNANSWLFAPSLTARLSPSWTAQLISSYGSDKSRTNSQIFFSGTPSPLNYRVFDNEALSIELGANGSIFALPAGSVKLAVGGGYRRNALKVTAGSSGITSTAADGSTENGFGYAEVVVPILSPMQASPLGRSLRLTGAFRYEANSGTDSVALPKLGVVYEPVQGLTLKGSWGRSFRLPTLYQRYSDSYAGLVSTEGRATGFPVGSTFISLTGSNPDLKPERSENWTFSAEFKPVTHPEFSGSVTYFHFDYTDRVAEPLTSSVGALNNPLYAGLITFDPTLAQQQAAIAGAAIGLENETAMPYDPAVVVAILDRRERNMAREIYQGVSLSIRYRIGDPQQVSFDISFDGNWIDSRRQLLEGLPVIDLSGNLFNPPKLKGRAGLSYVAPRLTLSGFANLSSSLFDRRTSTSYRIDGATTFDVTAMAKPSDGLELGVIVQNVLNAKPPTIRSGSGYDTPFDTTNFSPIGRFIALQIRRAW
jgi:outer membrane receptor protein involved in Fe transport